MSRTFLLAATAAASLLAAPAFADQVPTPEADAAGKAVDEALAERAELPAKPPALPSTASDRATTVHDDIAFGKKGDAERLAHSQAEKQGTSDAEAAEHDAANRAARGAAAAAAGAANGDAHSKAGHDRENSARGGTGTGAGSTTPAAGTPAAPGLTSVPGRR